MEKEGDQFRFIFTFLALAAALMFLRIVTYNQPIGLINENQIQMNPPSFLDTLNIVTNCTQDSTCFDVICADGQSLRQTCNQTAGQCYWPNEAKLSCGHILEFGNQTISVSGEYSVEGDLDLTEPIVVNSDNVIINGNDHEIIGSDYGLLINGKNCSLSNSKVIGLLVNNSDGIRIIDSDIGKYSFGDVGSFVIIEKSGIGKIRFLDRVNASGGNLNSDIVIEDNFVYVNSLQTGLNKSAEISLYGLNLVSPRILRNGIHCSNLSCGEPNSTSGGAILFRVGGWSNYTLINGPRCGDSIVDSNEQCDLGGSNGLVCNANYSSNCTYCNLSCGQSLSFGGSCGDDVCQEGNEDIISCSSDCFDETPPIITLTGIVHGRTYFQNNLSFNVALNEFGRCYFTFDDVLNISMGSGKNFYQNLTNLTNGDYTISIYCNDSSGNKAEEYKDFFINVTTTQQDSYQQQNSFDNPNSNLPGQNIPPQQQTPPIQTPPLQTQPQNNSGVVSQSPPESNSSSIIIIVTLVILILFVSGIIIYLFVLPNKKLSDKVKITANPTQTFERFNSDMIQKTQVQPIYNNFESQNLTKFKEKQKIVESALNIGDVKLAESKYNEMAKDFASLSLEEKKSMKNSALDLYNKVIEAKKKS